MPAKTPEEICSLFQRYMREGDVESVLSLYDPEAVFLNQSAEVKKGEGLREQLATSAAAKPRFDFNIRQVIQAGDIALMHTDWKVSSPQQMFVYAMEGRPSPAGWELALAHRRSIYGRNADRFRNEDRVGAPIRLGASVARAPQSSTAGTKH